MPVINIPSQNTAERDAFVDPANGSTIINSDSENIEYTLDNGLSWIKSIIPSDLEEIDLQFTYDASSNGTIITDETKPFNLKGDVVIEENINSYVNSSGSATSGVSRIQGMKFTAAQEPGEIMRVTHLQYIDANFNIANGATRDVGIYDVATQTLLGSVSIEKTDPLDGIFRTKELSQPVDLILGEDYVVVTVVPANEIYFILDATGISSKVASVFAANNPVTTVLTYPSSILTNEDQITGGGFQFDILTESTILNVESTNTQVINSTSFLLDTVATISDLVVPTFGEMNFQNNIVVTVIPAINTPVKVNAAYISGLLSSFTQSSGTLTYTGTKTKTFKVDVVCSLKKESGSSRQCSIYIAKNGSVITKSCISEAAENEISSAQTTCLVSLTENDTVECFIENNENDNNFIIEDLNFNITQID